MKLTALPAIVQKIGGQIIFFIWEKLNLAASISIVSLIVASMALNNTIKQFTIINQSYLKTQPGLTFMTRHINTPSSITDLPDSPRFDGLELRIQLQDIGNLPLRYKLKNGEIYFNGKLMGLNDDVVVLSAESVLYPKEEGSYYFSQYYFPDKQEYSYNQIKAGKLILKFKFEYFDFNSDRIKTIDRIYDIKIYNNTILPFNVSIKDKI